MRRIPVVLIAGACVALGLTALFPNVMRDRDLTAPRDPGPPASVTWDGKAWDCAQVAAWDRRYGAYEPDGTPVPYEVAARCTLP